MNNINGPNTIKVFYHISLKYFFSNIDRLSANMI